MAFDLAGFSEAAADAVATAGRSVVRVDGRNRDSASGIVWSAEGVIVTANHVLERNDEITVGVNDEGTTVNAEIVGRDPESDLALLRLVEPEHVGVALAPANWRQEGNPRIGAFAWAVARPGRSLQSTLGVVSHMLVAKEKGADGSSEALIQTDVLMYPGFSGEALVDATGMVLGLNSSALRRGASAALGYATVARVVTTLLEHGRMPRGFLGVGLQPVRLGRDLAEVAEQESGLMVMSVENDGPASRGGVTQGDVLLAVDGTQIRNLDDLTRLLRGQSAGKRVALRLARGGAVHEVGVAAGAR